MDAEEQEEAWKQMLALREQEEAWKQMLALREQVARPLRTDTKRDAWLRARELVYGLGPPQADHHCTLAECVGSNGSIELVDAQRLLYGCLRSGRMHECLADTDTCTESHSHTDGSITCTFSGIVIGYVIDERDPALYGPGKRNFDSTLTQDLAKLGSDSLSGVKHERVMHADADEARPKRARNLRSNAAGMRRDVNTVVTDLLFNTGERRRIDSARSAEMKARAVAVVRKMCKNSARERTLPLLHEVDATYNQQMTTRVRLLPLKFDRDRMDYYCIALCRLWILAADTPYSIANASHFHIRQHAVGVLYMLATPYAVEGADGKQHTLIEPDAFLQRYLPDHNALREWRSVRGFKYRKHDVTTGKNNFRRAIGSVCDVDQQMRLFAHIRHALAPGPHI